MQGIMDCAIFTIVFMSIHFFLITFRSEKFSIAIFIHENNFLLAKFLQQFFLLPVQEFKC